MSKARFEREKPAAVPGWRDLLAGFSVTLVLIPQALAYAELAGMPPITGIYAASLPAVAAALFASSPYLQTGPTALTALLTLGVAASFETPGTPAYAGIVALLALVVGVSRLLFGLLRLGRVAYLMSEPVLMGFTSAAGVLIFLSQVPNVADSHPPSGDVLTGAWWTLTHPASWDPVALAFGFGTLAFLLLARRWSPLFPGVLLVVVAAIVASQLLGYQGSVIGEVRFGLPELSFALPWRVLPELLLGGVVIAVVGFAEAASIARTYATEDRQAWSPEREFIGQGAANVVAGLVGGFPVGGSFSRSAVNRSAGAKTRWSGAVAGLLALLALPLGGWLEPLPRAVLGGIVMSAVLGLVRVRPLLRLWRYSRPQFVVALVTAALALLLAPRIDRALLVGVLLSLVVHLLREVPIEVDTRWEPGEEGNAEDEEADTPVDPDARAGELHLTPSGVLWFGSASELEEKMLAAVAEHAAAARVVIHFEKLGRIDLSGAFTISRFLSDLERAGIDVVLEGVPPQSERFVEKVFHRDADAL